MHRFLWSLLLIAAFVTAGCAGEGDTIVSSGGPSEGINVTGEGRVSAAPDIATIRLGVRVEAATVEEARERAAQLQTAVVDAVKGNGIENRDVQTSNFSIQPVYSGDPTRSIRAYAVTNTLSLKVRELTSLSKVIDDATRAGSTSTTVQGLSFGIDEPEQLKAAARELAIEQAKQRAEDTARVAGVSLGKPISISEGYHGGSFDGAAQASAPRTSTADTPTPIESGELDVVVTVQMVYRIDYSRGIVESPQRASAVGYNPRHGAN